MFQLFNIDPEIILKLLLATLFGGLIGYERTMAHKEAGMRTFALVSLGSCVFTILGTLFSQDAASRILANIVVGIGFLGGGLIFTQRDHIRGLTTAAALWTTAALGAVIGLGKYGLSFLITILVLFLLAIVGRWELKIRKEKELNEKV